MTDMARVNEQMNYRNTVTNTSKVTNVSIVLEEQSLVLNNKLTIVYEPDPSMSAFVVTVDIMQRRQQNCRSLRCNWSCSNYIFILDLTPGFNRLRKDNCKTRQETFKFWDLVPLILETLRYFFCFPNRMTYIDKRSLTLFTVLYYQLNHALQLTNPFGEINQLRCISIATAASYASYSPGPSSITVTLGY